MRTTNMMTYDLNNHRYVLKAQYCSEIANLSEVYADQSAIDKTLKSISRTIYNWIYSRIPVCNKNYIEYLLAKHEDCIRALYEAMLAQLEADISSGYNDIKNQSAINFSTGMHLDREEIRKNLVCIEAQNILEGCAFNMFYAGDLGVRLPENRYELYEY
jgi:hypothetical protein